MESILGVHDTPSLSAAQELGVDAVEADRQDQDDLRGTTQGPLRSVFLGTCRRRSCKRRSTFPAQTRSSRTSQDPVMPGVLQHARQTAEKHVQAAEDAKSDPKILGRHKDNPPKVQLLPSGNTPGRPMIEVCRRGW
jgi:hypothetical protein